MRSQQFLPKKKWEIQAKEFPEPKPEPAREEKQKPKNFNQGMITNHWVYFTRWNVSEMFVTLSQIGIF